MQYEEPLQVAALRERATHFPANRGVPVPCLPRPSQSSLNFLGRFQKEAVTRVAQANFYEARCFHEWLRSSNQFFQEALSILHGKYCGVS